METRLAQTDRLAMANSEQQLAAHGIRLSLAIGNAPAL